MGAPIETVASGSAPSGACQDFAGGGPTMAAAAAVAFPGSEGTDAGQFKQDIRPWETCLVAIGGSIGAGLLLASGQALSTGGPLTMFLVFLFVGVGVVLMMVGLGELTAQFPVPGSFCRYGGRFVDPAWGFAASTLYCMLWMLVFPMEIISVMAGLEFWTDDGMPLQWVPAVLVIAIGISACTLGGRGFSILEVLATVLKVTVLLIFNAMALTIVTKGVPGDQR